jgi:hypothetical protein
MLQPTQVVYSEAPQFLRAPYSHVSFPGFHRAVLSKYELLKSFLVLPLLKILGFNDMNGFHSYYWLLCLTASHTFQFGGRSPRGTEENWFPNHVMHVVPGGCSSGCHWSIFTREYQFFSLALNMQTENFFGKRGRL